jgi:hypothetical protein
MKKNGLITLKSVLVILFCTIIFTFTGCPGLSSIFTSETPQNLKVDGVSSDSVKLSWDAQSSASGYILYISTDASFQGDVAGLDVQDNNAVEIGGFQSSTTYYFRVTSYKISSESDPSESVSATTLVGAPTEVTMSFSNNNLSLSWNAVPRATGYICYYGLSSNMEENESDEILTSSSGSISTVLRNVATKNGLYYVWVFGMDENSTSTTYAMNVKRKGTPNYKFYVEEGPSSKKSSYSLDEVSDDTEVFLIKVNRSESSVSKGGTGGVTKVNNNFVDNSEKIYAKYSILGKKISRSAEFTPEFQNSSSVIRLDHMPSKQNLFDTKTMGFANARYSRYGQSRSSVDFVEHSENDTKKFWIDDENGKFSQKSATLIAEGDYCYVWVASDVSSTNSTLENDNKITKNQAKAVAQKFDDIYGPETTIFGDTYKTFCEYYGDVDSLTDEYGLVPPEEKISILICDIFGDYSSNQNSGVLGYFWMKDFYKDSVTKTKGLRSNETEIFYIDAHFLDAFTEMTYSTLAHEFQHMLNYVNKDIYTGESPSTWYNEMLSMVCEDLLQDFIGIEDKDSPLSRLPAFNYGYAFNGVGEWHKDDDVLYSYAHAYAFGAFITRNYGGAALVSAMIENEYVNLESILQAIKDVTDTTVTKNELLFQFARALCYPEGFDDTSLVAAENAGLKHFYRGNTTKIDIYDYTLEPICLFDYSFRYADANGNVKTNFGPFYFGVGNILDLRPYGISIHSFGVKTGKFTFDYQIPSSAYVEDYFVIQ